MPWKDIKKTAGETGRRWQDPDKRLADLLRLETARHREPQELTGGRPARERQHARLPPKDFLLQPTTSDGEVNVTVEDMVILTMVGFHKVRETDAAARHQGVLLWQELPWRQSCLCERLPEPVSSIGIVGAALPGYIAES